MVDVGITLQPEHRYLDLEWPLDPADDERAALWLDQIAADHAAFAFRWYTDHLGTTTLDGRAIALPIAPPLTAAAAALVRRRLALLQRAVPDVGVENSVFYFQLGAWTDEPAWIAGTVGPADVPVLAGELQRVREVLGG